MTERIFNDVDRDAAEALFEGIRALSYDGDGGVTRPSYSAIETRALAEVRQFARNAGLEAHVDEAANLHITDSGQDKLGKAVWIGSHIDSVPNGGNFDGLAGIVAGLLVLRKIRDRRVRSGRHIERPVRLVALRGEESAWFGTPHVGAKALFGKLTDADLDRCSTIVTGSLGDHMQQVGADTKRLRQRTPVVSSAAVNEFWELHIEQGPVLVSNNERLGIVTVIRGNMRAGLARIKGKAGHSGTTPRELRNDAVFAFAEFVSMLDNDWERHTLRGHDLVVTCGKVKTNAPCNLTRIPDSVEFCLEWRSCSYDELLRFASVVDKAAEWIGQKRGVEFDFGEVVTTSPTRLDDALVGRAGRAYEDSAPGVCVREMPSGAGHDAAIFAQAGIPTGMIFVRNANGSHNPAEAMNMDDFMVGVELLYKMVAP